MSLYIELIQATTRIFRTTSSVRSPLRVASSHTHPDHSLASP